MCVPRLGPGSELVETLVKFEEGLFHCISVNFLLLIIMIIEGVRIWEVREEYRRILYNCF